MIQFCPSDNRSGGCDTGLSNAVRRVVTTMMFLHSAHTANLLDAMGSMLLETFAKGFPLMGQEVLKDLFSNDCNKIRQDSIQTNITVWLFVMI